MKAARAKAHENHLEYMYGDYWTIYIDKNQVHYLELDIGHLIPEFISVRITKEDYESLKDDLSTFKTISQKVLRNR
jgi:hypothetical protein